MRLTFIFGVTAVMMACSGSNGYVGPDAGEKAGDAGDVADGTDGPSLLPSNGSELGSFPDLSSVVGPPSGSLFDTSTDCHSNSALGDCQPVALVDSPDVCVCRAGSFFISDLDITGEPALALFAAKEIVVSGAVNLLVGPGQSGPGAAWSFVESANGRAGGAGGPNQTDGGRTSSAPLATPEIIPLRGGTQGQGSCGGRQGGGAGGALQLSAADAVAITGTINAGGGGGSGGYDSGSCLGGAGGGSGGAVLVEAASVTVTGVIAANGGGGGGAGNNDGYNGYSGQNGKISGTALASGGAGRDGRGCVLSGYTDGGNGGAGSLGLTSGYSGEGSDTVSGCLGGTNYVGAGGGGGGAGYIRINSQNGCNCSGEFSPGPSQGSISW